MILPELSGNLRWMIFYNVQHDFLLSMLKDASQDAGGGDDASIRNP